MENIMYSEHAEEYSEVVKNNLYNALYERPSLLSMLPKINSSAVLDMGCGSGIYANELLERGANVTAIDSSEKMVSMVNVNLGKRLKVYRQDLTEGLPKEKAKTFDLVISPLVIHYVKDLQMLFSEVARVLKPNGCFLFSTHHPLVDFKDSKSGNYFETELLSQMWNTTGSNVEVKFYRRPLTALFQAIENSGMKVLSFNEGCPHIEMKNICEKTYQKLSTKPGFVFFKCQS